MEEIRLSTWGLGCKKNLSTSISSITAEFHSGHLYDQLQQSIVLREIHQNHHWLAWFDPPQHVAMYWPLSVSPIFRGTCVPLAKVSAVKDWLPGNHWASGIRGWMSVSRNRGKDWRCVEWRLPFLSETKRGNSHDFRGKEKLFEGFTPLKLKTIYKHDPLFCRHACGIHRSFFERLGKDTQGIK